MDGTLTVTDPYTMEYNYQRNGLLSTGRPAVMDSDIHSVSTDAFGNVSQSWVAQTFINVLGQAKLDMATSRPIQSQLTARKRLPNPTE